MADRPKPVVLAILDGWGTAPDFPGNAITRAQTPNVTRFIREFPVVTLYASGNEVGLSYGEMGNSEVGHLNIGAGRVYYQTLPRINKDVQDGSFLKNDAFLRAADHVKKNKSALHLIGLVSPGNVHASQEHLFTLLDFAKKMKIKKVFVHAILDGRDVGYNTAKDFITKLEEKMSEVGVGQLASMSGRYFAMDRDNRWDRVEKAYRAIVEGISENYSDDAIETISYSYEKNIFDEEFIPTVMGKPMKPVGKIKEGDACIFTNFRPDRARQLTQAIVLPGFAKFERDYLKNVFFVTMTEYEKETPVTVAYLPVVVHQCLAEVISKAGLSQFHVAETEKYAHITFFLNGTVEEPFPGEVRKIISSPKVSSYDQAPEMSAEQVAKEVVNAIDSDTYDVILCNFANADMVGHTGNLPATIKAVETVDKCLGLISEHVLAKNGVLFITADHGNAEGVLNIQTGVMDKEHSTNPVPFMMISNDMKGKAGPVGDPPNGDLSLLSPVGMLADVAPTVLAALNVEAPPEMSGRALF